MNMLMRLTCVSAIYGMFDYRGFGIGVILLGLQAVMLVVESIKDMVS